MELVDEFLSRYTKEFDFYENSSRIVAQSLEASLRAAGVRAIVTSRAKNLFRLASKVRDRAKKKEYSSVLDIYEDIVDLAGVRVALYFPGEQDAAAKVIKDTFVLVGQPKTFPEPKEDKESVGEVPGRNKRFSGYWATHYRVKIKKESINESQDRYTEASVEIQVASVLMHAWSEVEHDLVYKPLQGNLSEDEYAILDELNGLVLAGEIALERLQRAGQARASVTGREFGSHFDLAAFLVGEVGVANKQDLNDAAVGRVDLLFKLLKALNIAKPDEVKELVGIIHVDFEKRPIAEQLIDQVLSEDATRYQIFESIKDADGFIDPEEMPGLMESFRNMAIGDFIGGWISYEKQVRDFASDLEIARVNVPASRLLRDLKLPESIVALSERLRIFRNKLIHGVAIPDDEELEAATRGLEDLIKRIEKIRRTKSKVRKSPRA